MYSHIIRLGLTALFAKYSFSEIDDLLENCSVSTHLDSHVLRHFEDNSDCGQECILKVAEELKISKKWKEDNDVPVVRGEGRCRHGCLIEVRMSIPPGEEEWKVGTAFHKGACFARRTGGGFCQII